RSLRAVTSASWLPGGSITAILCRFAEPCAWIPEISFDVKVVSAQTGGLHGGTAVGGGAEIGPEGLAGVDGGFQPRGDCANIHLPGFQRGVRVHVPRSAGGRKERPPSGMAQCLQDGGGGSGHP